MSYTIKLKTIHMKNFDKFVNNQFVIKIKITINNQETSTLFSLIEF